MVARAGPAARRRERSGRRSFMAFSFTALDPARRREFPFFDPEEAVP
jgi:hypothetical protein